MRGVGMSQGPRAESRLQSSRGGFQVPSLQPPCAVLDGHHPFKEVPPHASGHFQFLARLQRDIKATQRTVISRTVSQSQ